MEVKQNMKALLSNNRINSNPDKSLDKLSSGYKINSSAGKAAELAVSEKINSQIEGLKHELINAQDGISMFSTFEGALSEINYILARIKSIAAANSVNEDQHDRVTNQSEFEQLILEIDSLAQTDFNGIRALTGEDESENAFDNFNATALGLGLDKSEVNLLTCENAAAAVEKIDIASQNVSDIREKFGKTVNHLERKVNTIRQTIERLSATESRLRDTDMSEETDPLPKNPLQSQIAQTLITRGDKSSKSTLNLLQ
jgi:flagellin